MRKRPGATVPIVVRAVIVIGAVVVGITAGAGKQPGNAEAEEAALPKLKPEELDGLAGAFPLRALAESQGYGAANEFLIGEEDAVRAACGLFTQDNIDLVRDYLLVGYALEAAGWLDSQAFEAWRQDYAALGYYDQLSSSATTAEETAFNLTSAVLPTPVGHAYAEAYNLEHIKEFVEGLCKDAIDSHKHIVTNSEWLSDASKEKLCEKLDGITAFTGQNVIGDVCVNEGLTEICGMQARLAYASDKEDFDYKAFFESRAKMIRNLRTPEFEQQCIQGGDTHPSAYLDTNGAMQQFDEFYETYDVQEGDGMYLAPEARIALW